MKKYENRTGNYRLVSCFDFNPGLLDTPNLMSQMIHSFTGSFTGSILGTSGGSMLHQMGYPSKTVIIPLIQYSFVGLAAVGIGFVGFGSVAKKIPK